MAVCRRNQEGAGLRGPVPIFHELRGDTLEIFPTQQNRKGTTLRKKLRPDNKPYIYAYDIQIENPPDIIFTTARNQQALWNWMATEHLALVESLADADKAAKKATYDAFWRQAYDYVRDEGERLNLPCWAKWQIYDAFKVAQAAWAKKHAGMPSVKRGLRKIKIENRTVSGTGAPISWLREDRNSKPVHLRRETGLTRGYFVINDERIHFSTVLHRPMAEDCILKRYALCGEYEPAFREWRWKMVFLTEQPPREVVHGNAIAGLDLGWRIREKGLRIGVLWTPEGARELFLPFNLANRSERKQMERFSDTEVTRDIRGVWDLQRVQDEAIEAVKERLRAEQKDAWPEDARELMSGIVKMRAGGLRRLRRALFDGGVSMDYLDDWFFRHIELSKRIRKAQLRIYATRNTMYRNLAAWLSRNFAALAWEDDLSLKDLAEDKSGEYAIDNAQKYRQFAGLSILRGYIREKMASRIPEISGSYTTQECYACGAHIESGASLHLTCENGHQNDQDVNAARVLYNRLPEELRAVPGILPSVDRSQISRNIRAISL